MNAIGDRNARKFTKAMTHDAAVDTKMKYLNKDNNLILVADNKKHVVLLPNLKKSGRNDHQPHEQSGSPFWDGP